MKQMSETRLTAISGVRRPLAAVALLAVALAACGGPTAQPATPAATQPVAATSPAVPTAAPTVAPTIAATMAPTVAPTTAPTAAPTAAPTTAATAVPTSLPTAAPTAAQPVTDEILFLRGGELWAHAPGTGRERRIAEGAILDFAVSPDGAEVALVREQSRGIDLWAVRRDGAELRQLTDDAGRLVEATPYWSPDGAALVFAAADTSDPYPLRWPDWALWCSASTVQLLDLQSGARSTLGEGCDPQFSPDGRRVAFATPPTASAPGITDGRAVANTIRLVNRQGENGWSFARAEGDPAAQPGREGLLVYGPAFSPDGQRIVYHRFLGYQALVDLGLTETGDSFEGNGQPVDDSAGWRLPARFAPDGRTVALSQNNFGDARGFGGYDDWSVSVVDLSQPGEVALPSGPLPTAGSQMDQLPRAQAAAWSPDGAELAVQLPPGWRPDVPNDRPFGADESPGEIWRWSPGRPPSERLVVEVDFASPIAWVR